MPITKFYVREWEDWRDLANKFDFDPYEEDEFDGGHPGNPDYNSYVYVGYYPLDNTKHKDPK